MEKLMVGLWGKAGRPLRVLEVREEAGRHACPSVALTVRASAPDPSDGQQVRLPVEEALRLAEWFARWFAEHRMEGGGGAAALDGGRDMVVLPAGGGDCTLAGRDTPAGLALGIEGPGRAAGIVLDEGLEGMLYVFLHQRALRRAAGVGMGSGERPGG